MRRLLLALIALAAIAGAAFFVLTMPSRLEASQVAGMEDGDAARGERMFNAGGCASCHSAAGAQGDERLKLGGGLALATPFGTFRAPNISPDRDTGIGAWSGADFANAMLKGVSPSGAHYYPAFPYASYARMKPADIADLWAYMKTLPAVARANDPHQLPFPFNVRRGVGLWKLAFLSAEPVATLAGADENVLAGRYLVEGPGHCGECHTPRNLAGAPDRSRWLAGGPAPEGSGRIPNITPDPAGIGSWSAQDIAYYLESGLTPDFDSVGGPMVDVQRNMARLPPQDREAIAAYLKAVPARQ